MKNETAIPIAIVQQPSPRLKDCEPTFLPAQVSALDRAARQHRRYGRMLRRCGLEVVVLDVNADRPDSVFIEDTAIVLGELAIKTSMGTVSRRPKTKAEFMKAEAGLTCMSLVFDPSPLV